MLSVIFASISRNIFDFEAKYFIFVQTNVAIYKFVYEKKIGKTPFDAAIIDLRWRLASGNMRVKYEAAINLFS